MKLNKEIAMGRICSAFSGFRVEFIEDDSIAIRARVFYDEHGMAWCNLPMLPSIGYQDSERLEKGIKELREFFDERYAEYLKS
ncbi:MULTISPECIES: hypothetical protein [Citrobacter]|uniref:hypothetical protein n=1 Tax=Citrobacter TaxID=544 RepID=UPI0002728AD2|nr:MULTISPECIES: hypothetical protein [Citrobacter]EHH4548026.1 hypothetical protein [Escherichia coli]EJF24187.1 hypothetical protein WYG_1004 [Citrobacter sp. A1]EJO6492167.1 hypothetical protein [Citrobacter freundii]EKT8686576.1 hypothetical protein [Citrobacter freundii]EKU32495.1 hypothetical protein B397_4132 [Citrobacter sp. L17]